MQTLFDSSGLEDKSVPTVSEKKEEEERRERKVKMGKWKGRRGSCGLGYQGDIWGLGW